MNGEIAMMSQLLIDQFHTPVWEAEEMASALYGKLADEGLLPWWDRC